MLRSRTIAGLVATAAVLLGTQAGALATASADSGYISVEQYSAGSPTDNVGLLSFALGSDQPITSLTATIVPVGGGSPLLSLPMTSFTVPADDGDGYYGTWTLTSPITTSQLALGSYWVDVTATSSDASISDVYAGTLNFLDEVSFPAFAASDGPYNYDNQDVTFTGSATLTTPGGSPAAFADQSLDLTDSNSDEYPVETAQDGSFTITVPAKGDEFFMTYGGDSDTESANSAPIQITVTPFTTSMTATLSAADADYGQAVTVSGRLTYDDNGTVKPLTGATISLYYSYYAGETPTQTAVTDSNGDYSMPVPTNEGSTTWTVLYAGSQYFTQLSDAVALNVAEPNFIHNFHASLSAFAVVTATGCVENSAGKALIEYAAKPAGPWRVLGPWDAEGLTCQSGGVSGEEYSGKFTARLASAYYRAVFIANDQTQGATSATVHRSRLLTRITAVKISPTRVAKGSHFTVSGRLWAKRTNGKWYGYAHRRVIVVFKYRGTYYRYNGRPKTSASGRFSGRFPVYDSTPVFAQYNGDSTHFASASKRIRVTETAAARQALATAGAWHLLVVRQLAGQFPG